MKTTFVLFAVALAVSGFAALHSGDNSADAGKPPSGELLAWQGFEKRPFAEKDYFATLSRHDPVQTVKPAPGVSVVLLHGGGSEPSRITVSTHQTLVTTGKPLPRTEVVVALPVDLRNRRPACWALAAELRIRAHKLPAKVTYSVVARTKDGTTCVVPSAYGNADLREREVDDGKWGRITAEFWTNELPRDTATLSLTVTVEDSITLEIDNVALCTDRETADYFSSEHLSGMSPW